MNYLEKLTDNHLLLLRTSLGVVFLWFGVLKFFPGVSPADELAGKTINALSFGIIDPRIANYILAVWETGIGLGFLSGRYLKIVLPLFFLQMAGTFTPLFLYPSETFSRFPYAATLEGQYIVKNIVLIAAGLTLASKVYKKNKS